MTSTKTEKKESLLLNLALNILIPTLILTKFSTEEFLGPKIGIVIALAFPVGYGIYDYYRVKKLNFFSALGVVSVLLTGGISLFELDPKYIAIKEASIPAILGIATLASILTPYPLVRLFLYNDKVLQTEKIASILNERGNTPAFDKTLIISSYMVAGSFFVSSFLNYVLAKLIVVSEPGTEAFAVELGKMTAYSYVVIFIPSIVILFGALFYLFREIKRLTGLSLEEIVHEH